MNIFKAKNRRVVCFPSFKRRFGRLIAVRPGCGTRYVFVAGASSLLRKTSPPLAAPVRRDEFCLQYNIDIIMWKISRSKTPRPVPNKNISRDVAGYLQYRLFSERFQISDLFVCQISVSASRKSPQPELADRDAL